MTDEDTARLWCKIHGLEYLGNRREGEILHVRGVKLAPTIEWVGFVLDLDVQSPEEVVE